MCNIISEPEHDYNGNVLCPKCGKPLWFYRIYNEPLVENEDIIEIGYTEWDEEYVVCRRCGYKPSHEWYDQMVILA